MQDLRERSLKTDRLLKETGIGIGDILLLKDDNSYGKRMSPQSEIPLFLRLTGFFWRKIHFFWENSVFLEKNPLYLINPLFLTDKVGLFENPTFSIDQVGFA